MKKFLIACAAMFIIFTGLSTAMVAYNWDAISGGYAELTKDIQEMSTLSAQLQQHYQHDGIGLTRTMGTSGDYILMEVVNYPLPEDEEAKTTAHEMASMLWSGLSDNSALDKVVVEMSTVKKMGIVSTSFKSKFEFLPAELTNTIKTAAADKDMNQL